MENNDITGKIINELYDEIELFKKSIFNFKSNFLNSNFNKKLEIIAIKKYILYNLFDSFEQTLNNIKEKILRLDKEIQCIKKENNNSNKDNNNIKINKTINYMNENSENKYELFSEDYNKYNVNNKNINLNNKEKRNKQNINIINFLNKNNHNYRKELYKNEINLENYNNDINNNITNLNNYREIKNINKVENNNVNYYSRTPGNIIRKMNSYNSEIIILNKKNNNKKNNEIQNKTIRDNKKSLNTKFHIINFQYPALNNENLNNNKCLTEIFKINRTNNLNKNNSQKDNLTNYFKIEKNLNINNNNEFNIKIKSPIREVIKKLIKNKKQINESFSNYCNMTNSLQNRSYDFNRNDYSKNDIFIEKIKNSENLTKYFSKKYGEGNFDLFLNKYKENKISHDLVQNEIILLEKINEKCNNNNHNNNYFNFTNNIENSTRFINKNYIKTTPDKNKRNKIIIKNKTVEQKNSKEKLSKTGSKSDKRIKKFYTQKQNIIIKPIKNRNNKGHQTIYSFKSDYLQTDTFNNKIKKIIPQTSFYGDKDNSKNNIYKRYKTPINELNICRNNSFL